MTRPIRSSKRENLGDLEALYIETAYLAADLRMIDPEASELVTMAAERIAMRIPQPDAGDGHLGNHGANGAIQTLQ